jgi:purine nucleoside phosphorylase
MRIGLIGGTGANLFTPWGDSTTLTVSTLYGEPVAMTCWQAHGHEVLFIPRHGSASQIPPHRVNYRANIAALKKAGVSQVVALNAVGVINDAGGLPGTLTLPHQFIDYTYGREHTFYDGAQAEHCGDIDIPLTLQHVECTEPLSPQMRQSLLLAAAAAGIAVTPEATCAVMQGPRLETAAEIDRLERVGCQIVGMTMAPEAGLAIEAGLPYASIAGIVNYAAGRAPVSANGDAQGIHDQIGEFVEQCMTQSHSVLDAWLQRLPAK